ncbi:type IV secretion system protein VirB10 [Aggregatibacter kilianii]|uniref:type IV secretion system protein VirB10 n=1 Tax=Aggregatibacter kilianii TaxID=2025884 RepID=UPI000D687016|nr:type IV secretion system protein VirB10 [Aggregatibacter kilianii]
MRNDDKQDLGGIPDVGDSLNGMNDRNDVETGIVRKRGNKTLNMILGSVAGLIIFGTLAYLVLGFDAETDSDIAGIAVKQDEALLDKESNNNSLDAQMLAIKKQQEEEEALRKKAEEEERLRKLREQQEAQQATQQEAEIQARINGGNVTPSQNYAEEEKVETPAERRLRGTATIQLEGREGNGGGEDDPNSLNNALSGEVYAKGSAKMIRGRELLLIHGTQIPCVLQTRLVTDHPSILICQVTKNIFSADGSTLLIERGSKVFGEQKKAIITGQNMAFVSWSEVDTPNGVRVRIDSLGTDSLGASGVNVWVDEKWGKRFGSAILLSFIKDALSTGSQVASRNSNGTIVYENSEQNTGRMAEIALENSINIQPTGYALQGQLINILVARDIDFSSVYSLK